MGKKLSGKALAKFEAERDVWEEVLHGVREIKAGGGKRTKVEAKLKKRWVGYDDYSHDPKAWVRRSRRP